ncbi:hypothetical protein QQ045_027877 [Rhodiola kirilowii]
MEAIKEKIAKLPIRRTLTQIINLGVLVSTALILWKIWMVFFGTISPLTVVLSGSMEPGFQRGDALLLHMDDSPIRAGDIVVFTVEGHPISIVHRVIKVTNSSTFWGFSNCSALTHILLVLSCVHQCFTTLFQVHQQRNATQVNYILTKGDNNDGDDRWGIYADGQEWVDQKDVQGKVFGILRYVGWPTIIMNDYPLVKYFLLGSLSLVAILTD